MSGRYSGGRRLNLIKLAVGIVGANVHGGAREKRRKRASRSWSCNVLVFGQLNI